MERGQNQILKALAENMAKFSALDDHFKMISNEWNKVAIAFANCLSEFPRSVKVLAKHGWYVTWEFEPAFLNHLADELEKGNTNYVDSEMVKELDEIFPSFYSKFCSPFPHRKAPITAALEAHNRKEYYLSIPVFFSQIEGICKELTGARFFSGKQRNKRQAWVDSFETDSIIGALMAPLKEGGPMGQLQDEGNPIGINRHDVLHGDSNDYGDSAINSYKVLSLLAYVATTIKEAKE